MANATALMPPPYNSPSAAAISWWRISYDSLATIKVYRLVSVYFQALREQWFGTEGPHGWWVISMPDGDASEGNERMNRDTAKRSQNVVLGVKHLDSGGASPRRPRPDSLAGRECKGCPAPHRDPETQRPTRAGRFRAVLGLGLSRLSEFVVAWNRRGRDRQLLEELSEWSLRDIGIDSTTAERDISMSHWRLLLGLGPGFAADRRSAVRRDGEYPQP